jgi:hypothetical protein
LESLTQYGGTAKYVGRYGSTPAIGSKYGLLFNTNNKAIRRDDVLATYQNSLVKAMANFTKTLTSPERNEVDKAIGVDQIKYQDYKIDLTSTRAKPSGLKIREMEQQLIGLQETVLLSLFRMLLVVLLRLLLRGLLVRLLRLWVVLLVLLLVVRIRVMRLLIRRRRIWLALLSMMC